MSAFHFNVIPECYADTLLVNLIGIQKPNHTVNSNLGAVLKTVSSKKPGARVVGIIDSDKGKSERLLKNFEFIAEEYGIKKYQSSEKTILILCPAFEKWVYHVAKHEDVGILPEKFGFDTEKMFRKACKNIEAKNNQNLRQFFNALKQKQAPGLLKLQEWIIEGAGITDIIL
ncbi:MAG: hypothetical protein JNJ57_08280 [Saprospiraceae bacterium]|nr:hypothetical protein [Saprospiraceae bacterium]